MKKLFSATRALCAGFLIATGIAAQAQAIKGDAAAGQSKNSMCVGCHGIVGYQASFPEIYKVPMIAGQNASYIASALAAYKKGDRRHPSMRGIADTLSEQDMADLGAYYESLGGPRPAVPTAPTVAPGPIAAAVLAKGNCGSCHGANFNAPIIATYPKLAGQHADALYAGLKAYQTDGNALVGRNNAVMGALAKQFSHAELRAIAEYLSSLPGDLRTVPQSKFK
jgi:cytochrome c553